MAPGEHGQGHPARASAREILGDAARVPRPGKIPLTGGVQEGCSPTAPRCFANHSPSSPTSSSAYSATMPTPVSPWPPSCMPKDGGSPGSWTYMSRFTASLMSRWSFVDPGHSSGGSFPPLERATSMVGGLSPALLKQPKAAYLCDNRRARAAGVGAGICGNATRAHARASGKREGRAMAATGLRPGAQPACRATLYRLAVALLSHLRPEIGRECSRWCSGRRSRKSCDGGKSFSLNSRLAQLEGRPARAACLQGVGRGCQDEARALAQ
eukprot:scaffold253271_cov31-Tisochrysis_lutea.AAC.4